MFQRPRSWFSQAIWKPKNLHSLEHLKFLYSVLCKNQTASEHNRGLLIETLRSMSEILIWGDQNDSSVFDFFLEKNMLSFFLRYLQQKSGKYLCVQLLQTLNILFENISNETSLYYLLSNNHVNSIIVHKFDFSDEEVMAYYISFLKTLSLKLNRHTIHFFYNEHTNDFALYTEAIKFFNHSESMVRIAVRTITLNVYKVEDKAMLRYIRDRTAAPYFSNLVWFIGNHILDLDLCVRHDSDHRSRDLLADLVAEHLDHLHYLNDIFSISLDGLNEVLTDQLLNRLLIPLYVYSLTKRKRMSDVEDDRKHVSSVVALFLLSQVFLIFHNHSLVQQLAEVIFQGDISLTRADAKHDSPKLVLREFQAPVESLEKSLESVRPKVRYSQMTEENVARVSTEGNSTFYLSRDEVASPSSPSTEGALSPSSEIYSGDTDISSPNQNSTDEEKLSHRMTLGVSSGAQNQQTTFSLDNKPYLEAIFNALECSENDYSALFSLCLLYGLGQNEGISQNLLDSVLMPTERSESKDHYNIALVERLIRIITLACQTNSKVRLATLQLSIKLLKQLVLKLGKSFLQDRHLASIENAHECSRQMLRNFYKSEEIFLDMFEDEYRDMKNHPLNVEYLTMDSSILLSPTGTPLTGIDFSKRLPCGEVERARRAIRVFFILRDLSLTLLDETEVQLPLTKEENCIRCEDKLDLNNSDLIACTVITRDTRKQERRFLVIDPVQLVLVEPDNKRLGWGVVRFVAFLQDIEVTGDKDDSRSLHILVHKPSSSVHARPLPLLAARFMFDDHIRCMAAKQRLMKGRIRARQQKMQIIERMLDIAQTDGGDTAGSYKNLPIPGRSHPVRVGAQAEVSKTKAGVSSQGARPKQRNATAELKKLQKDGRRGSREIRHVSSASSVVEEAQEATSAFAVQSLNHHSHGRIPRRVRSHSGAVDSKDVAHVEIPMEDLSISTKARSGSLDNSVKILKLPAFRLEKHRSQSHSPRRHKSDSSVIPVRAEGGRKHAWSAPPPHNSRTRQTSLINSRPHSKSSPASVDHKKKDDSSSDESPDIGRSRSQSGMSPKSLRPAPAPSMSLIPHQQMSEFLPAGTINSPKLVPPAEPKLTTAAKVSHRKASAGDFVSVGDGKDRDKDNELSDTKSTDSDFSSGPNLAPQDSNSDSGVHSDQVSLVAKVTTKQQLAELAQEVQEHYGYSESKKEEQTG
ncbi:protein CLEC16A-like [Gigantopelta aegis]|uniref:protein CLEC16A-like n=1 Tax=Gigantopelta aegis TaxID=1735272 RepID=UPI001B8891B7|nr:protein CLEC16A-like [Gigantopelta aegis]